MKTISIFGLLSLITIFNINAQDSFKFSINDVLYETFYTQLSWEDAAAYALSVNGKLVEINSQAEQDDLWQMILSDSQITNNYTTVNDGGGIAYIWIGATDKNGESDWQWNGADSISGTSFWSGQGAAGDGSGTPVDNLFNFWGGTGSGTINEPDDYGAGQDAAAIALAGWPAGTTMLGEAGEWNDIDLSNELYFIVEYIPNSISSPNFANSFVISPNPAKNKINISSDQDIDNLSVYNLTGKLIISDSFNSGNISLDINLPGGIYLIKAEYKNKSISYNRLIIR